MTQKSNDNTNVGSVFLVCLFILLASVCFCVAIDADLGTVLTLAILSPLIGIALCFINKNAYGTPAWWWTDEDMDAYLAKKRKLFNVCDDKEDKKDE